MSIVPTLRCTHCDAELPPLAKFCPFCAEPTYSPEAVTMGSGPATPRHRTPSSDSSSPLDNARFVPGQVLLERYRIVALIGKGGMGEVYRAEDLRLGQTVALKFLPERLTQDGAALARLHREVRVARQVSHPNVCRVFDVGEAADIPFLTMEYVDGEDLASLLRRIGRLPQDKAIEIARQLCAGLAAAHDNDVLHRDLKPSNVMLDSRGKVRITDFGLAGIHGDDSSGGTPAYMAPEQLAGKPTTVQSEIYSLGLVLYEIFTGKRAFDASTLAELTRLRAHTTPTSPTKLVQGLDPMVERVILRCLENEPSHRPTSALQVAAALPGGDPLAAALAAGETPSPEMVAAAGGEGALRPRTAWLLLLGTLTCAAIVLGLAPFSTDLGIAPMRKAPEVLEDRAQAIVKSEGYTDAVADHDSWSERNYEFLHYRAEHLPSPQRIRQLANAEQGVRNFYYRQSPRVMVPSPISGRINSGDPPYEVSGMVTVLLDSNGQFEAFLAVPPQIEQPDAQPGVPVHEPDWNNLFVEAGLDPVRFRPSQPKWLPPVPFDRRLEWDGSYTQDPNTPIHVLAASYEGRLVFFHVIGPWTRAWRMQDAPRSRTRVIGDATFLIAGFVTLLVAAILARRNIQLGRGDRKGAFRVSCYIFFISWTAGILMAHHVSDLRAEWVLFVSQMSDALFFGTFVWLYYMAFEPYVRRQWPQLLISWTRLVSGRFSDPLIGRDILVGGLVGSVAAVTCHLVNALPAWFNLPGETPIPGDPLTLGSPLQVLGVFFGQQAGAIFPAFALMFLLFLARTTLRRYWLAVVATGLLYAIITLGAENFGVETPNVILTAVLCVFLLVRFGILALAIGLFVTSLLLNYPMTLDFSRWYANRSAFALAVLLGMAVYGFRSALGGRPVLGKNLLDEER